MTTNVTTTLPQMPLNVTNQTNIVKTKVSLPQQWPIFVHKCQSHHNCDENFTTLTTSVNSVISTSELEGCLRTLN